METRKEKYISEIKEDIINAASIVFCKNGYEKATTRMIAKEAHVALGTLYNYFKSKRDLLVAYAEKKVEEFLSIISENADKDIKTFLYTLFKKQFENDKNRSFFIMLIHEAWLDPEFNKMLDEKLFNKVKTRFKVFAKKAFGEKLNKDINIEVLLNIISSLVVGFNIQNEKINKEENSVLIEETVNLAVEFILNYLSS